MDTSNTAPPDPKILIDAVRARLVVVCQKHPNTWAIQQASKNQVTTVNIALQEIIGTNRDDRIRVLQAIFPDGLDMGPDGRLTTVPLTSSKQLTKAQASVLMELLYHLTSKDSFYVGRPLYQRAIDFFSEMVMWTKRPLEQIEMPMFELEVPQLEEAG